MSRRALGPVSSLTDIRFRKEDEQLRQNDDVVVTTTSDETNCLTSLPPIASCFAILLILIYNMAERWGIEAESQVGVSWQKVVTENEVWRLSVAHFFHFSRATFIINVTSIMALGRYLEKKIRRVPMVLLILLMGTLANVFHMILCIYICEAHEEHLTSGFSHVVFALKMVQVLSKDGGRRRGPTLLLGFIPMYLGNFAPWEPLFEGVLADVLVKGKHFATHVSGVLAGVFFPILDYYFHESITVPSRTTLIFSESSGSQSVENRSEEVGRNGSKEEWRFMKRIMAAEGESRVQLFHELPSDECITLFYRNLPMKETSVHDHHSSKSDSYLLRKNKIGKLN